VQHIDGEPLFFEALLDEAGDSLVVFHHEHAHRTTIAHHVDVRTMKARLTLVNPQLQTNHGATETRR